MTVVEITDPTTAGEALQVVDQNLVQLGARRLRARRVTVQLGSATVVFHRTNRRVRAHTTPNPALLSYTAWGPRTTGSVNGVPIRSGMMVAVQGGTEVSVVADAGYESVAVLLPPEEVEAHLRGRQREGVLPLPRGVEMLRRDAASVRRFYAWGRRLVDTAVRHPAVFNDRRETRVAAQVEILETLMAALGAASDTRPPRGDSTRRSQGRIIKLAEDYALSHVGDRVYVTDLCRAAGVSERSLEYAFRGIMGMTAVAYLMRVRLHRVRQALQAAGPGSTTVSAEALREGFWHFGEFSRAYRDCFGELPSATLRRPATAGRQ